MKYVFICGLHRSGTSNFAQEVGQFKGCAGFGSTGRGFVLDEGQYLQDVYPPDTAFGGVGRYGFAPQSHLTEESPLLTPANISRLRQSWEAYWDGTQPIRVEKTPGNLLKTRFLQAAFPDSSFIVIKRHPVAVSLATQKWSRTPLHELFRHWLHCHAIFDGDKKHLKRLYELSYEEYIQNPKERLADIARFIGTEFSGSMVDGGRGNYNKKYLDHWARSLDGSVFKAYYRSVRNEYEPRFQAHDYSLSPPYDGSAGSITRIRPSESKRPVDATILYGLADVYGLAWRAGSRIRAWARRTVDSQFPQVIRTWVFRCWRLFSRTT